MYDQSLIFLTKPLKKILTNCDLNHALHSSNRHAIYIANNFQANIHVPDSKVCERCSSRGKTAFQWTWTCSFIFLSGALADDARKSEVSSPSYSQ